jgi:hypothetical protein
MMYPTFARIIYLIEVEYTLTLATLELAFPHFNLSGLSIFFSEFSREAAETRLV